MGWEQRGCCRYYYRKRREGRQVLSEYMGRGPMAMLCAAEVSKGQQARTARRRAQQQTRREEDAIDRQLDDAETALALLVGATLRASGYHKHKGQWRKKRHE
ncbi:MAG: hypothetical protein FJ388_10665 [Verrucomicrobia bacterium]|nr:hypothetical protein [Verrucomicrobiota bacterium]